jgi:hypothetical protein
LVLLLVTHLQALRNVQLATTDAHSPTVNFTSLGTCVLTVQLRYVQTVHSVIALHSGSLSAMACSAREDSSTSAALVVNLKLLRPPLISQLHLLRRERVSTVRVATLRHQLCCLNVTYLTIGHQVVSLGPCRCLLIAQGSVNPVIRVR